MDEDMFVDVFRECSEILQAICGFTGDEMEIEVFQQLAIGRLDGIRNLEMRERWR